MNELAGIYNPLPVPPVPEILTLSDLLADQSTILSKEEADKALLESIGAQSIGGIKPKLLEWVRKGYPDGFPILELSITPPSQCSDGEVRGLTEYIEFCSGKSMAQHVDPLQAKLPDIRLSFANIGGLICVTALRA